MKSDYSWLKFTDICEGNDRKYIIRSESRVRQGCEPLLLHAPDRLPFEASLGRLEERPERRPRWRRKGSPAWLCHVLCEGISRGRRRRSSEGIGGLSPKRLHMMETKPKNVAGRITSSDKKCKQKGKGDRK